MNKKRNILCIIPARGGSKRLKHKNTRLLLRKPVIAYTIEAAQESKLINKIVISTDDAKISRVAKKYNIQVIKRPKKYCTDSAPIELALRHAVRYLEKEEGYVADIVVWLQANVPIRKKGQIDNVILKLIETAAESAVTMYAVDQYPHWMKRKSRSGFLSPFLKNVKEYRFQDVEPLYLLDGAVVVIKKETLMGTEGKTGAHVFLGKKTVGIIQEKQYTIEIDSREDFARAKSQIAKINSSRK